MMMVHFTTKNIKSIYTKEDFSEFSEILNEMTSYIIDEKGDEVISERHQKDYKKEDYNANTNEESTSSDSFTDVSFDDI